MRTPNVTKEELDEALARGLEKAREIHQHVERYERAAYDPYYFCEARRCPMCVARGRSKRTAGDKAKGV